MERFLFLYNNDPEFKNFVESLNNIEFQMSFVYDLYLKYKDNKQAYGIINSKWNIENVIEYYSNQSEYEKCSTLMEIKRKIKL